MSSMNDDDDICDDCGHDLDLHMIAATVPHLKCPGCPCQAPANPILRRAVGLLQAGQVRQAQRLIDAAVRRRH